MRVLLAIDDSECSEAAVQAVIDRFKAETTEALVIHVIEWPKGLPTSMSFAEGAGAADDVLAMHAAIQRNGQRLVDRAVHQLQAAHLRARGELREGDARHVILDCAADWKPDVIVLGSHGRRGLGRFLLGSVSESVVRHAPCSVDVVRVPAGITTR